MGAEMARHRRGAGVARQALTRLAQQEHRDDQQASGRHQGHEGGGGDHGGDHQGRVAPERQAVDPGPGPGQESRAQKRPRHIDAAPLAVAEGKLLLDRRPEGADEKRLPDAGGEGHGKAEAQQARLARGKAEIASDGQDSASFQIEPAPTAKVGPASRWRRARPRRTVASLNPWSDA
jgi:hypothetical protein